MLVQSQSALLAQANHHTCGAITCLTAGLRVAFDTATTGVAKALRNVNPTAAALSAAIEQLLALQLSSCEALQGADDAATSVQAASQVRTGPALSTACSAAAAG